MRSCEVYTTDTGDVIELPMILPSSWLKRLLKDYPFLLSGGRENALQDQPEAFWTCFHFFQPEHVAFQKSKQELRSTIPLLLHGDEGRYLKKGNYMVCTIETPIGQDGSKKEKKVLANAVKTLCWVGMETLVLAILGIQLSWPQSTWHPSSM